MLKIKRYQKTKTEIMGTKTTLIKAVKFVNNCKFIFSFRKNIFQKNIFSVLFCFIIIISLEQAENFDLNLKRERNSKISSSLDVYKNSNTSTITIIRPFTDSFKSDIMEYSIAFEYRMNRHLESKNWITS